MLNIKFPAILLTVGSDRNLFKEGSDIWNRYLDYGKLFEEIHVIVFSHKNLSNKNTKIGDNIFIYPTDHIFKIFYLCNVYGIVKKIIRNLKLEIRNCRDNLVVTAQDPFESGLAAWMIKKIYKIRFQIQIHTDFLSLYYWKESFSNKLRVILARFLISRADGIRVVSERIKASLVASGYSLVPITVLPIFIDSEDINNAPINIDLHNKHPQFNFIILMASRLTKEKNIGLAIKAMAELIIKYPKLGLVIVGSGPELESYRSLVVGHRLENNVKFEPFVAQDVLFSYYKTADLFLLTSNYEGYGRTIIEAMVVGLPVVMTDVGLAGEILINDKNGIIISVGDEEALASILGQLIKDDKKRNEFSFEGKRVAENLMTKEQYLGLYKKIIESIAA